MELINPKNNFSQNFHYKTESGISHYPILIYLQLINSLIIRV